MEAFSPNSSPFSLALVEIEVKSDKKLQMDMQQMEEFDIIQIKFGGLTNNLYLCTCKYLIS